MTTDDNLEKRLAVAEARVDAVRALAESLKWVRPDKPCDNAEACCGGPSACDAMYPSVKSVGAATILAALDAVEPADQPHPTPEADCGHPNHGANDHDCTPFAPEAPDLLADQPHPTPEAPSGRVVNGFQVCSAHDLAECPFCESDQR